MKRINSVLILLMSVSALTLTTSCEDDRGYADYDPGTQENREVSGEWFIMGYETDGATPVADYARFLTYDAETIGDNDFYIEEYVPNFELKSKVQNNGDLMFSGQTDAPELVTGGTVTISNGKIIKDGGRSTGGTVVDSIYFEAEFDWDPGYIYKFGGHRRTGFEEDEH